MIKSRPILTKSITSALIYTVADFSSQVVALVDFDAELKRDVGGIGREGRHTKEEAKPILPTNFEENTWATLKSAISSIFLKQPDPCDLEKLYQAVNDLCLHKMGGNLYQRIENECETHISPALQSLVGQSEDLVVFLSLVEKCWQDFCDQILMIRGIALYLDQTYVKQTPNVRSLWDMGLQLFRKHLSLALEVEYKTVFGLLKMIESERFDVVFLQ